MGKFSVFGFVKFVGALMLNGVLFFGFVKFLEFALINVAIVIGWVIIGLRYRCFCFSVCS